MTSSSLEPGSAEAPDRTEPDPKRWLALGIIAVTQLMVVLDASIVNVALPRAQADLGISDADRQWVVTAYTLAFGGLLLLGGRIADFVGRKRTLLIGLVGFRRRVGDRRHRAERRRALRGPRAAGRVRRAARAGGAVADHRDVHRDQGARPRVRRVRRVCPAVEPRSAWSSAASSPSTRRGAGASASTSRSRSRSCSRRSRSSARARPAATPATTSSAPCSPPSAWSVWSTASPRPRSRTSAGARRGRSSSSPSPWRCW